MVYQCGPIWILQREDGTIRYRTHGYIGQPADKVHNCQLQSANGTVWKAIYIMSSDGKLFKKINTRSDLTCSDIVFQYETEVSDVEADVGTAGSLSVPPVPATQIYTKVYYQADDERRMSMQAFGPDMDPCSRLILPAKTLWYIPEGKHIMPHRGTSVTLTEYVDVSATVTCEGVSLDLGESIKIDGRATLETDQPVYIALGCD